MKNTHQAEEFNSAIGGTDLVIIKFEANWRPDCRAMDMWVDPVVGKYNNYQWYVADRDKLEDVTTENDVMGIPSILIFQNDKKLAHLHSANAKSPEQVESFLTEHLDRQYLTKKPETSSNVSGSSCIIRQ